MRPDENAAPLAGRHVLVTRPAHQAGALCGLIEAAGGRVTALPTIEIAPPADPAPADALLARLHEFDLAVFVSANAVHSVHALLRGRPWPPSTRIAAVGRGSAAALACHGWRVDVQPAREFTSEGLLAESALRDPRGWRVLILRGDGGRELLADTLRARGAEVVHAEVYRRILPAGTGAALARVAGAEPAVDTVVASSNEGLLNLYMASGEALRAWLLSRDLVVIGTRAAALAATLGFERPARIAAEASDDGLFAALAGRDAETIDS
jgi:uroporphyrinogen-III synthase